MGCTSSFTPYYPIDPEIEKILNSLNEKCDDFKPTLENEEKEFKIKLTDQFVKRYRIIKSILDKGQKVEKGVIKKLNEEELEIEIDFLLNAVYKMHYIFDLGLELSEPLREYTINNLLKKAKIAPSMAKKIIKEKIEEIKSLPVIEFLYSAYGKVLRDAMVKNGMSATVLSGFKRKLLEERQKRREDERIEFKDIINEFEEEKFDYIKFDFYSLVEKEYDNSKYNISNFKEYARNKMIDMIKGSA